MARRRIPCINVIDLFAGPGGLGEGFAALENDAGRRPFRIRMSVEKEASAHATLTLRAFLRYFAKGFPPEYEAYRRGEISRESLFGCCPREAGAAHEETMGRPVELGKDNRLIRQQLNRVLSGRENEPWVVIGGPPCQAYSLAGRSRNQGKRGYRPEKDERNFLYREYLKILARVQPEVFVMENVRGILSARVHGERIFRRILEDLEKPAKAVRVTGARDLEYRIHSLVVDRPPSELEWEDYLICSERFGIPQARHRVILLGIRTDIKRRPRILEPSGGVNVRDVITGLPIIRSRISRGEDSPEDWEYIMRKCVNECRSRVPPDVYRVMRSTVRELDGRLPVQSGNYPWKRPTFGRGLPRRLRAWLAGHSESLHGHVARSHMPSDLARYFFAACWATARNGISPRSDDYPAFLAPDHANWESGKFPDRFRVQSWNRPSSTITSHIAKDGHYFIHPDPIQCRSLTPREAARLQTFPDDYHFEGNRTQQYHQIGNAVPPWLAHQIAEIVYGILN